ncbi:uncharacterized protein LOC135137143 [Zophobas morio]|uniref:uncharacterized protein LOC135137143 n=1 Tax=Zophobas morio TaxID=2755281 RepID=UPI00308279E8
MDAKPSITRDEVSKVIANKLKSDEFDLVDYSLRMLGEWVGLCGDHAILETTIKQDEETQYTFFVKLYPRVPLVIEFIEGTGSFKKEIFVYRLFDLYEKEEVKILAECVPKCYLSIDEKFLVMENLIEQGYTSVNKYDLFDYDTLKVVLEALSKLHASTLIYEERTSRRLIDVYEAELEETYYNERPDFPLKEEIEAAITGILNSTQLFNLPDKLLSGKNFRTVLEEVCRRVHSLARPSKSFRNVVCHGDIWATNLVIKRDHNGTPVRSKLVDFQCGRYVPPAQDVMSVIHLTTAREFRKRYMYNLIGIYYTCLEKHVTLAGYDMKKIIPFEEFLASCEEQKVFAMVQTGCYFPLILLESQEIQDFFGDKEKNKDALYVDRSILVKAHLDDEKYSNRMRDCLLDLKEYCDYL